jgi:uncharacterized protein (DUF1501 family)
LAEAGVRFIEIASGVQWDHHNRLREQLATNCAATDQPIAALLSDLKARGMLKDTLVVWAGEFGRTPYAQAVMVVITITKATRSGWPAAV